MLTPFAVDLGYGFIKWSSSGKKYGVMPSLVARGRDDVWNPGLGHLNGARIKWGKNDFFVGEMADAMSKTAGSNQSRSRIQGEEARAYLYAALAQEFPNGANDILMVTGLPVDYLADKDAYKEWNGEHVANVDGKEVAWGIHGVFVAPQGFGGLCDVAFEKTATGVAFKDKSLLDKKTLVADMGTLTFNAFSLKSGVYQAEQSGSKDLGMRWAIERVREGVNTQYKVSLTPQQVDEAIREGFIHTRQGKISIQKMILPVLSQLAQEQAEYTLGVVGDQFGQVDTVIVTGGGAHHLGAFYTKYLGHHNTVIAKDSQGGNVRGYLHWATYIANKNS